VKKGEFNFDEEIFIDPEKGQELEHHALLKNDLIITRSGSVGFCKLFDICDDRTYIPSGYVIVLKVNEDKILPRFLEYYLSTKFAKRYFEIRSSGKTQKNISQTDILSIPIPNISNAYQEKIINEIGRDAQSKILALQQKIESLQDIVDDILIREKIKKYKFEHIAQEQFEACYEMISNNSFYD